MSLNATIDFYDDGVTLNYVSPGRGAEQATATILMMTGYNGRFKAIEKLLSKAYAELPQDRLEAFLKEVRGG